MKPTSIFAVFLSLVVATQASPMYFDKRRFGVEHTPEADKTFQDVKDLAQGTDKEAQAGNLSGAMVRALLAKAPVCDQQNRADEVIDLGIELGKKDEAVEIAKRYRQLERNTPGEGQASELCKEPPKNEELDGLTQAQDPTGKGKAKENPKEKAKEDPEEDPEEDPKEDPKEKPKGKPKGKAKEDPKDNPKENAKEKAKDDDDEVNPAEANPVGGVKMPKIEQEDGDFIVNGNGFNGNLENAQARQCDIQRNQCFNKFNAGDRSFSTEDCDNQAIACKEGPPVFA